MRHRVDTNTQFAWVRMPLDLLEAVDSPVFAGQTFVTKKDSTEPLSRVISSDDQVAMKNAVMRSYAARFTAKDADAKMNIKRASALAGNGSGIGIKQSLIRSAPLGIDRHGCQYWMFTAQAVSPLIAFAATHRSPESSGPQLLVRSPAGAWKVSAILLLPPKPREIYLFVFKIYISSDINDFVKRFSIKYPQEGDLRNHIIDR